MMWKPKTGKGQTPKGHHQMQHVVHEGDFTRQGRTTCHLGLGSGRAKVAWVIGPTANGFGGKEKGAVVLSQGGSGHHGKETMGRRGTTGEPTELVNWQNVGEVRKREESIRIQLVWVGEWHEQNPKQRVFCKFCFCLEGGNRLNCSLTTASQNAL